MSGSAPGGVTSPPPDRRRPDGSRHHYPYRVKRGRTWAGVANGIARYLDIDVNWVRIGFIVATFVGGIGLVVYLAAWLALPEENDPEAGTSLFRTGPDRNKALLGILLLLVVGGLLMGDGDGSGFVTPVVLVAAGVGLWVWRVESLRSRTTRPEDGDEAAVGWGPPTTASAPDRAPWGAPPASARVPSASEVTAAARPAAAAAAHVPMPARAPRPPRSPLGALTVAGALLAFAAAVLVDRLGWVDVPPAAAMGTALAVVAVGLLVSAFVGRARGVIWLGILLSVGVAATSAVGGLDLPFTAGVGEKRRTPATLAEVEPRYELTMGELIVDLSQITVPPGETVPVEVNIGIGQATITVPDDVDVEVMASAGLGTVKVLGHEEGGVDVDYGTRHAGPEGAGAIAIDASAVTGEVIVQRSSDS